VVRFLEDEEEEEVVVGSVLGRGVGVEDGEEEEEADLALG